MKQNVESMSPGQKAHHTAKWARTMAKWLVTRNSRNGVKWRLVEFGGPTKSEACGIVDLIAIRKAHRCVAPNQKRGDLFEIILIQTKGGSAPRPTPADNARLARVARYHRAKAVVLVEWRRKEKFEIFRLKGTRWQSATPDEVFG